MSLLSVVEEAIKLCKDEQAKMHVDIQRYREILLCFKQQNKIFTEDTEEDTEKVCSDPDIPPEEREEIELLERALKKALRIRSNTETSKESHDCSTQYGSIKEQNAKIVKPKDSVKVSRTAKLKQANIRPISKSSCQNRTESKTSLSSVHGRRATTGYHSKRSRAGVTGSSIKKVPVASAAVVPLQAPQKVHQPVSSSSCVNQGQSHACITQSKYEAIQGSLLSSGDMSKAATTLAPSPKDQMSVSHTDETRAHSSHPQHGISSEQVARWKFLWNKKNRMWDEVMAIQKKPVQERSHFMERIRTTFPEDWPCGSPDQTRTLLDRLLHQGQDLTHYYQQSLAKQASKAGTESGSQESKNNVTLENIETMAAELRTCSTNVKREWEAWDRCRPEGGCLCPAEAKGVWGNEKTNVPLLPTVIYTKEKELRELEKLRMEVVLLRQEVHLQQALSDALYPQVSSMLHGPGCPNPAMLRDTFSLLAEGGERFPSLVLDTEPN